MNAVERAVARMLAVGALFSLAVSAASAPAATMLVAMCGGGTASVPVQRHGDVPERKCPFACHMASDRKRLDDEGEGDER